jgi:hypothetical protein|tara:strand:+ start:148 stop:339 length:192 start_codon:yes stop_codon:yes gene_type:complete
MEPNNSKRVPKLSIDSPSPDKGNSIHKSHIPTPLSQDLQGYTVGQMVKTPKSGINARQNMSAF